MTQPPPPGQSGSGYYQSQQPQQPYPQQYPQGGGQYQGGQYQGGQYDAGQYQAQPQYAQPPAAHPQPQPYGDPPPYGSPPPPGGYQVPGGVNPPPKKSGKGKLIAILGGVGGVVLLGIAAVVVRVVLGNVAGDIDLAAQVPEVGECITQGSLVGTETEVVACDSAEAAWQVLGNVGSYSETDFEATEPTVICADYPDTGYVLWIGELTGDQTGSGEVVCLLEVIPGG